MTENVLDTRSEDDDKPKKQIRLGIAGLGTVGCGLLAVLKKNGDLIANRSGCEFTIGAVTARDRQRKREVDISAYHWCDNPVDLADPDKVDVVVELIGGSDGPALALARAALGKGLSFVTANKAMIAHHGAELASLAERTGASLRFEAAVAGGIPIVKTIKEGLAANRIDRMHGILNGTGNYILTMMEETGESFENALAKAQALGYAEADPSFDIDGVDTAHKIAILTSLAFGTPPTMDDLPIEGIRNISDIDIAYAKDLGFRIKLLGISRLTKEGKLDQRVHASMVEASEALAKVSGASNAIEAHGDFVGPCMIEGLGAGAGPTASAVMADLIELARGNTGSTFSLPASKLAPLPLLESGERTGEFYVRLRVSDKTGVMADIASALRDEGVSVERLIQRTRASDDSVHLIMTTHKTSESRMACVLERFSDLSSVLEKPCMLRIEPI
ncbi:homoserine dehydrogenase [Iodidimonas muriae]|uniref:Homoserine dehydrogenase n=1 Tax=Iodidimonas muriae TaxID=261467 RepID=A0ABQ2L6K9_9PROT|nr:homoserine dehydrogenase [Iodidimonas muriae]GER06556.1 homoserine dehydrogenase [Kordiimonadales bacterium JCM 17843]GGO05253.1 homoserine dehydrogenase [Iodidimonas muriae]